MCWGGAAPDPHDAATKTCAPPPGRDYTQYLKRDALAGARIGIPRAFFYDAIIAPGEMSPRGGLPADQQAMMLGAIAILKHLGATVVDPADIPSVVVKDAAKSFLRWDTCRGYQNAKGKDAGCSIVAKYGKPGYPTVLVPFGMVANPPNPPFPPGFDPKPQPFGVSFAGMACSEPRLIALAYAFEQATRRRVPPPSTP